MIIFIIVEFYKIAIKLRHIIKKTIQIYLADVQHISENYYVIGLSFRKTNTQF